MKIKAVLSQPEQVEVTISVTATMAQWDHFRQNETSAIRTQLTNEVYDLGRKFATEVVEELQP